MKEIEREMLRIRTKDKTIKFPEVVKQEDKIEIEEKSQNIEEVRNNEERKKEKKIIIPTLVRKPEDNNEEQGRK